MSLLGSAKRAAHNILGKALATHGFSDATDRSFVRVRGELIDGIGVQFGRGAESFYLHYFVKPVADLVNLNLSTYRIGHRMQASRPGANDWTVDSNRTVEDVFRLMSNSAIAIALPYFESVVGLRDYVVEVVCDVNYRARLQQFDLAVALAGLGKTNKVIQVCEETMQAMSSDKALPEDERRRIHTLAAELRSAATQGKLEQLIQSWKVMALEQIGQ